jgi:hypothetical protein
MEKYNKYNELQKANDEFNNYLTEYGKTLHKYNKSPTEKNMEELESKWSDLEERKMKIVETMNQMGFNVKGGTKKRAQKRKIHKRRKTQKKNRK